MGKLIIVENDSVTGTDKHNVSGNATNPSPPPPTIPYAGIGDFDYLGKMTVQLCDFVRINEKPVALKSSKSSLNPGENAPPSGKHSGPMGKNFMPPSPVPIANTLSIKDPIGVGKPSITSGSTFVKIGGAAVLLDGDKIDTCDGLNIPLNSTVAADYQDFVSCSA